MRVASFLAFALMVSLAVGFLPWSPNGERVSPPPRLPTEPPARAAMALSDDMPSSRAAKDATERGIDVDARAPSSADEEELLQLLAEARKEADASRRREMLAAICLRWAGFDPAAALRLALDLRLDPLEGALLPNLAQQWAARDFSTTLGWAGRLPAGELRDAVYSRLVYERARIDPRAAKDLLAEMRAGETARQEAALTVLHFWADRDPESARAWAAETGLVAEE